MSFLKLPRREPQKLLSRRRESERKKRDEREREDISGFFQQNKEPGQGDVQNKKQAFVSDLSSLDEGTSYASTHNYSQRRNPLTEQSLQHQMEDRNREASRTSTYVTWSTSHGSPGLSCHPSTTSKERRNDRDERSPTPLQFREALARSGIFNNTGIPYSHTLGLEREVYGANPKDDLIGTEFPIMDYRTAPEQAAPIQPVRIVRYQDRGTMADQNAPCTDGRANQTRGTSTQSLSTDSECGRVVAQDTTDGAAVAHTSVSAATVRQPKKPDALHEGEPPKTTGQNTTSSECEDGLEIRPDRPKSPKWTVIERLEAAAENVKLREILPAATHVSQAAQEHTHPVGKLDIEPIMHPTPVQMPSFYAPNHTRDATPTWPASRFALIPGRDCGTLSALYAKLHPSLNPGDPFDSISPPYGTSSHSIVPSDDDECTEGFFAECLVKPMNMYPNSAKEQDFSGQQRGQQSIHDYISEIEEEVLGRTLDDRGSRTSPIIRRNDEDGPELPDLTGDNEPYSVYTQPCTNRDGSLRDGTLSTTSHHSWTQAQTPEEDEEQKFILSFWRPNHYPD